MSKVAFRTNPGGSVVVTEHRFPITISKRTADFERAWAGLGPNPTVWEPKPGSCWDCKAVAMYKTKERTMGEELAIITFQCGECGMVEDEPID